MITALYVGIFSLFLLVFSIWVIRVRWQQRVLMGDGGNSTMLRIVRGHANFIEYVPMILIIMLVLELSGEDAWMIHMLGLMLVFGRIVHAICFFLRRGGLRTRQVGILFTFLPLLIGGILCIVSFI